jgi:hypothetical protein
MDFAVIHTINDVAVWDKATAGEADFPDGFSLPVFVIAEDKSRAICVWHAPQRQALQDMLDGLFGGDGVVNDVFPVSVMQLGESAAS